MIRRAPKTGILFVLEEVPFEGRRRWYCHLDGADGPSFDHLEEAVIWGLDCAAGVVVRTLELGFYLAVEHPPDWGHDLDLRPWPPSKSDRLRIEGAYVAAVALAAQDEVDQRGAGPPGPTRRNPPLTASGVLPRLLAPTEPPRQADGRGALMAHFGYIWSKVW